MRVLVTGSAGFIGQRVAAEARRRGHLVAGVDTAAASEALLRSLTGFVRGGLDSEDFASLLSNFRPDACVHLAGRASVPASVADPAGDFTGSVPPLLSLLEALRRQHAGCRVVFASSAAVYGDPAQLPVGESASTSPLSPYGFHKTMCEDLLREYWTVYGLKSAAVRIFSAYGVGLRKQVVHDLATRVLRGGTLVLLGSSGASRDFIHVDDVAAGLMTVVDHGTFAAEAYNLASGIETTVEDLAKRMCSLAGRYPEVRFDGVVPVGTPIRWQADITKIKRLGFAPSVGLDEGLSEVLRWLSNETPKHV